MKKINGENASYPLKMSQQIPGNSVFAFQFEIEKANDIVQRKLDENRAEYNQLMIEALLPPPQSVCRSAVHVENVITFVPPSSQFSSLYVM